jgi:hypothetical protein
MDTVAPEIPVPVALSVTSPLGWKVVGVSIVVGEDEAVLFLAPQAGLSRPCYGFGSLTKQQENSPPERSLQLESRLWSFQLVSSVLW